LTHNFIPYFDSRLAFPLELQLCCRKGAGERRIGLWIRPANPHDARNRWNPSLAERKQ
jgi:hypothetical protein